MSSSTSFPEMSPSEPRPPDVATTGEERNAPPVEERHYHSNVPRVLLLLPTTTYRAPDFLEAGRRLGVDVTVGSEEPSTLEAWNPEGLLTLDFRDPAASAG